jgi:phage terminase small subunit
MSVATPFCMRKHERFAQALAGGESATEAHASAGYTRNRKTASQLRHRPDVSGRVEELLAERAEIQAKATVRAVEVVAVAKADIVRMLLDDRKAARERGQIPAAIRAAETIARVLGHMVERKDVRVVRRLADLTDAELDALLADADQS